MTTTTDTEPPVGGFKPSVMQWVIGALLLAAMLVPIAQDFTIVKLVALLVVLAAWAFWVWRNPDGGRGILVPLLAVATAFLVGAVVIVLAAGQNVPLLERIALAFAGYWALLDGAFLKSNALTNTLVASTPLILTGLAVTIGFRSGLFNIGAEGQFMIGALAGAFVGYAIQLPPVLHVIVALVAGALGGALWGAIPGVLKAKLGAHEVINTIMMNFIAIQLADWLVNNPMRDDSGGSSVIRTPFIHATAELPRLGELFPMMEGNRLHLGFFLALLLAVGAWWLLWKTTVGFELRTAGSNLDAARYAGIRAENTIVLAMMISGGLAGLAGAIEVLGVTRNLPAFFSAGYGFDAIAVALLSFNHPIAVIPSGILFGALRVGSDVLQIRTGVSRHVVSIIQALILLFVAAPAMIRWIFRMRADREQSEQVAMTRGWGG